MLWPCGLEKRHDITPDGCSPEYKIIVPNWLTLEKSTHRSVAILLQKIFTSLLSSVRDL